jgi:hypothetical protein
VWLGLLDLERLHAADKAYYDLNKGQYADPAWIGRGLIDWERRAIDGYFPVGCALLVASAGGGREILALARLGYEVDGFECHEELCESARNLAAREHLSSTITLAPRDHCPAFGRTYDGLIVGWGGYMLIQGRARRIEFLRELRRHARAGTPILLSFYVRPGDGRHFRLVRLIAGTLRSLRRGEPVEIGDDLAPNYVHYFTKSEIASELKEAGFALECYWPEPYGHAVGIAQPVEPTSLSSPAEASASTTQTATETPVPIEAAAASPSPPHEP